MRNHRNGGASRMRSILLGATMLAGGLIAAPVMAQTTTDSATADTAVQAAPPTAGSSDSSEVVVTGVRKSLADQAFSKRTATNFTDSIFAEDIGKFPDLNLAEALNRVPGVFIARDIDGSGIQIQIRGLNPSFSKILLNGAQIAVATDGGTDNGNSNREVDLDLFPTELFTKVTVAKTPVASQLEGGIAGTVDFVNARPFDNPGQHVTFTMSDGYGDSSGKYSPRGALIASKTWDNTFGVLFGYAASHQEYRTDGFETIGWTTPNLSAAQCNLPTCNTDGGKGFSFPATVPSTAGNGLTAGTPIDAAFLLAHNPGTTLLQLGNALMPRLARDSFSDGTKARQSALLAFEYKPNAKLHFNLDLLYGHAARDFNRVDMDWSLRNSNFMVPLNVKVDPNNVVTQGTFANSQFFVEARPYDERVDFYNIDPSVTYEINDWIHLDGKLNWNRSLFFREAPSFLFNSPLGITVNYSNPGGDVPTITPSVNLNNPNLGWTWNRVNIQNVKRVTSDEGTHWDLTLGDKINNIRLGFAYDDTLREITAFDGSSAYQNCIINGTASTVNGVNVPCNPNNQVLTSAIPGFLTNGVPSNFFHLSGSNPGYTQFVGVNYNAIKAASNYAFYNSIAQFAGSSATATPSGNIEEKNTGGYIELNGVSQFMGRDIYFNGGARYVETDQTVFQLVSINNVFTPNTLTHDYGAWLPSFNVAAHLTDSVILRLAASRSMTRPNPNNLLPGTTFSDPSAQVANSGNPNLQPFFSDNTDVGLEWYTGGLGYLAADYFYKSIDGFTETRSTTEPFSALGIPLSALSPTQQLTGITLNTPIQVNTPVNIDSATLHGLELTWNQPLDRLVALAGPGASELAGWLKGAGFTANWTKIKSRSSSSGVALGALPNIPSSTYNLAGYYENHNVSIRLTYVFTGSQIVAQGPQNGVNTNLSNLISDSRGQYDMSASYTLPNWLSFRQLQLVFNAVNMSNEPLRTVFQFENAPYTVYYPGRQFLFGIRGKF